MSSLSRSSCAVSFCLSDGVFFSQVLKYLNHILETSVPSCMGASADSPSAGSVHWFCFPLEIIF